MEVWVWLFGGCGVVEFAGLRVAICRKLGGCDVGPLWVLLESFSWTGIRWFWCCYMKFMKTEVDNKRFGCFYQCFGVLGCKVFFFNPHG